MAIWLAFLVATSVVVGVALVVRWVDVLRSRRETRNLQQQDGRDGEPPASTARRSRRGREGTPARDRKPDSE